MSTPAATLHQAAKDGDLAAMGDYLSVEADINAVDKLQRTPLHLAAWAGREVGHTSLPRQDGSGCLRDCEPCLSYISAQWLSSSEKKGYRVACTCKNCSDTHHEKGFVLAGTIMTMLSRRQ
jgi:hypothetical protein